MIFTLRPLLTIPSTPRAPSLAVAFSLTLSVVAGCSESTTPPPADLGTSADSGVSPDADTSGCWQGDAIPDVTGSTFDDADGAAGDYPDPTVSGSCGATDFEITSNGIPTYEYVAITPNGLGAQSHHWYIPREPAMAATLGGVPMGGPVAFTVTGLPIFGPTEAPNDGYRDPVVDGLLDSCGGHTAPPMGAGTYHMHGSPTCLVAQLGGGSWGLIVGFAFDGYPILADRICDDAACSTTHQATSSWRLINGTYDDASASAWNAYEYVESLGDLDVCNGLEVNDPALPFDYAYVATTTFPYYVGCYRGTPDARNIVGGNTSANFITYPSVP